MKGDKIHAGLLRSGWAWNGASYFRTIPASSATVELRPDEPSITKQRLGPWTVWVVWDVNPPDDLRIGKARTYEDLRVFTNGMD